MPDPIAPPRGGIARLRPTLRPATLNLLVIAWLLATCNAKFWHGLQAALASHPISMVALGTAFSLWAFFILSLLAVWRLQKPVLALCVLVAASSAYYQDVFGAVIDRSMMQNVLTTTVNEGKHLLTPQFALYFLLRALPGLALVFWPRVRRRPLPGAALRWVGVNALALAGIVALLAPNLRYFMTTLHDHRELIRSLQPLATLDSTFSYGRMLAGAKQIVVAPYGTDARPGPLLAAAKKPVLLVIVAGETARAHNWALGGYARDTNPELARRDIVYYPEVVTCGTGTAVSLPCLFSPLTREEYSYRAGLSVENLLDVFGHAGLQVQWWDNNTGDKNVAKRFGITTMSAADDAAACTRGECMDGVFLPRLGQLAQSITQDTVVVLHQIGSHGPSYWLRYPPEDEFFKPACHTSELSDCSHEELVNAYDNTIRHTDWFLSQVIDTLAANTRIDSAMVYVSDHGESLGENGIYLHSSPYVIAPTMQTRVPMVLWMAPDFRAAMDMNMDCLRTRARAPASHDNFFSTVLGLMDIATTVRDPALDLTAGCRTAAASR